MSDPQRQHAWIAGVQRDLNRFLSELGSPSRIAVDGEWDEFTEAAFRDVCRILGIAPDRSVRTFRLIAGGAPAPPADELAKRQSDGAAFATALRAKFAQERGNGAQGGVALSADEAKRASIATLQRDLNTHLRRLHTGIELAIDGEWDESTDVAFKQVCKVLGIAPEQTARTFRIIAGAAAPRTAEELARAKQQGSAFAETIAKVPRRVVLGGPSLPKAERDRAYIAFVQRTLNDHLLQLGSPAVLAVDGKWGKDTQRAFEQVCRTLGVKPERRMRTFRIIAGALAARTDAEQQLAASQGKAFAQQLRSDFAHQAATIPAHTPVVHKPATHEPATQPASAGNQRIAAAIRAHGGQYEAEILAASAATKIPVAFLCAMLDVETGFSNVFGHDGVKNPIKSPNGSNRPVTKELYLQYKHFRDLGQ